MLLLLILYISKSLAYDMFNDYDSFSNLRLNDVQTEKIPYIVRLATKKYSCTGTILSPQWLLTAAHCVKNEDELKIIAGINNAKQSGQEFKIKAIHKHPKYAKNRVGGYDLALIEVVPLNITVNVSSIELDGNQWPQNEMYKRSCISIGWGSPTETDVYSQSLKMLNVSARHGVRGCKCWKQYLNKRLVCLTADSPLGFCHSDSGGPLICNNKLVGVMHMTFKPETCSVHGFDKKDCIETSGSFMYLCPFLGWINSFVLTTPSSPLNCRGSRLSYNFFIIFVLFLNKQL